MNSQDKPEGIGSIRMVVVAAEPKPDQMIMVRCRRDEGFLIGVKHEEH